MSIRAGKTIALIMGFLFISSNVRAREFKILLLPQRDWRASSPFVSPGKKKRSGNKALARIQAGLVSALQDSDQVRVIRSRYSINSDKPSTEELLLRGFLQLGTELYRHIKLSQAKVILQKGLKVIKKLHAWSWMPGLAAQFYFYLGLCNIDLGHPEDAQMFFRRVFILDPTMKIQTGYYPRHTERAFDAAFLDYRASLRIPDFSAQYSPLDVLHREKAEAAVFVYAYKRAGHDVFGIRVIDPTLKDGHFDREFDSEKAVEKFGVQAFANAFLACARLPWKQHHKKKRPRRIFMDTTALYMFYAKYPTRRFLHNAGFNLGFSFSIRRNLDIVAGFSLATSLGDAYGDMVNGFTIYRFRVGVAYSYGWSWGHVFVSPGISIGYLGGYTITTNANCKFLGADGPGCQPKSFNKGGDAITFSLSARVGIRFKLAEALFFTLATDVSGFFAEIPLSGHHSVNDLNLPIGFEGGLSYKFR